MTHYTGFYENSEKNENGGIRASAKQTFGE